MASESKWTDYTLLANNALASLGDTTFESPWVKPLAERRKGERLPWTVCERCKGTGIRPSQHWWTAAGGCWVVDLLLGNSHERTKS